MVKVRIKHFCMVAAILAFFMFGCSSSKVVWYKKGAGQADFNIDNAECRKIAEVMGKTATLTGKKMSITAYNTAYEDCIYNRGWSTKTPQSHSGEDSKIDLIPVAELKDKNIIVFNRYIFRPPGFKLIENRISMIQGVKSQFINFQNDQGIVLNLVFQKSDHRKFEETAFPIEPPFFIYDKGRGLKKREKIRWSVFSGKLQGIWVAGIGGYFLLDPKRRISIILTSQISAPQGELPEGLRLTRNQKNEVDALQKNWLGFIKTVFGAV